MWFPGGGGGGGAIVFTFCKDGGLWVMMNQNLSHPP